MAVLPTIDECIRCTYNWSTEFGVTPRNVQHFLSASYDELALVAGLEANLTNAMFNGMNSGFELESITTLPLDGTSGSTVHPIAAGTIHGESSSDIVPMAAAVVSMSTGTRGPKGRGRIYVGPLGEEDLDAGKVAALTTGAMQPAWTTFLSAMNGLALTPVVASYVHATTYNIRSMTVSSDVCTQRRRLLQTRA